MSAQAAGANERGAGDEARMRTLLICHAGAALDEQALARWLASFSELVGVIVLREPKQRMWRRVKREWRRVGGARFFDVLAFRLYYRLFLAAPDRRLPAQALARLCSPEPALKGCDLPYHHSH